MSEYRHIANLTGPQGRPGTDGADGEQGPAGIGRRGNLTESTNIDEFRTSEHIGFYVARADNLDGGPPISGNPLVTLEVIYSATNAVIQRATTITEAWWRAAADSFTWAPWQRISHSPVISTDRYVGGDLDEGQVLYIIDEGHRAYDFNPFLNGLTRIPPATGGAWIVNAHPDLLEGRGIMHNGGALSAVGWDESAGFTDGDILVRMARGTIDHYVSSAIIARAHHSGGLNAYAAFVARVSGETRIGVASYDAGSYTSMGTTPVDIDDGEAFWVRMNLQGDLIRAKAWAAGDTEPNGWGVTVTDGAHSSGLVGFRGTATRAAYDVLSINTSGGAAA